MTLAADFLETRSMAAFVEMSEIFLRSMTDGVSQQIHHSGKSLSMLKTTESI